MPVSAWFSKGAVPDGLKGVGIIGAAGERSRKVVLQLALIGVLAAVLVGCTALPGRTLDPMPPALGLSQEKEKKSSGQLREWIGRYRDSRRRGEIALTLTQEEGGLQGTWQLQTGPSGKFAGTLALDGRTLAFTMQGSDQKCPGVFAGRGEYTADRIRGTYAGSDCLGAIKEGYLELRRK